MTTCWRLAVFFKLSFKLRLNRHSDNHENNRNKNDAYCHKFFLLQVSNIVPIIFTDKIAKSGLRLFISANKSFVIQ